MTAQMKAAVTGREEIGLVEPPSSTSPRSSRSGRAATLLLRILLGTVVLMLVAMVIGPRVLPYRTNFVRSGSMEPTLPVGSLATYTPVSASDLGTGDIISFNRPGGDGIVTHRIIAVQDGPDGREFVTKGDANGTPDSWRIPATGQGWLYRFNIPYLGYASGWMASAPGRTLVLVGVVLGLAAMALWTIWKPRKADGEGKPPDTPDAPATGETLRDALSVVLGYSDVLLHTTPTGDPRRDDVEALREAARRAATALRDGDPSVTDRNVRNLPQFGQSLEAVLVSRYDVEEDDVGRASRKGRLGSLFRWQRSRPCRPSGPDSARAAGG